MKLNNHGDNERDEASRAEIERELQDTRSDIAKGDEVGSGRHELRRKMLDRFMKEVRP